MGLEQPNEKKNKNTASIFEKLITMVEQPCDFVAITVTWFNDLRRNGGITDVCLPASGDKINIFSHTPEISEDTENVCYICRSKKQIEACWKCTWRTPEGRRSCTPAGPDRHAGLRESSRHIPHLGPWKGAGGAPQQSRASWALWLSRVQDV